MFGKTISPFMSKTTTLIAATGLAAAIGLAAAPAAKADSVQFGVTVGDGYGGWGGGWHHPHPHYWSGYDSYDDDGYDAPPPPPPPPRYAYRLSCSDAASVVRDAGFRGVRATDCSGRVYQFDAWKNGQSFNVDVTSSGRIVGVDPNY